MRAFLKVADAWFFARRKERENNGEKLPAWFKIVVSDHAKRTFDGTEDEEGMEESLDDLKELIETEEKQFGIKPERIVVGGFCEWLVLELGGEGRGRVGGC